MGAGQEPLTWLAKASRLLLGEAVFSPIRRIAAALLTPLQFSFQNGHFRSSLKARAVNRHGEPVTWYTYPANHFLSGKRLETRRVLEFRAGQSTLWWAKKVAWVLALESNDAWFTPTAAEPPYERVPLPDF